MTKGASFWKSRAPYFYCKTSSTPLRPRIGRLGTQQEWCGAALLCCQSTVNHYSTLTSECLQISIASTSKTRNFFEETTAVPLAPTRAAVSGDYGLGRAQLCRASVTHVGPLLLSLIQRTALSLRASNRLSSIPAVSDPAVSDLATVRCRRYAGQIVVICRQRYRKLCEGTFRREASGNIARG